MWQVIGRRKMRTAFGGELKEGDHLGDKHIDGRIMLQCSLGIQ